MQYQLRPYLAQPYQSALKVLDCYGADDTMTVDAIATQTQLSKASVRQILRTLRSVGLVSTRTPANRRRSPSEPDHSLGESSQPLATGTLTDALTTASPLSS